LRCDRGWRTDLVIETHDSLLGADKITPFLAAIPDAQLMWDAHHTWRKGGEDPVATWRAIRAAVVHIHVKDSIDRPSLRHPFTYVLPGDGAFPMAALKAELRTANYSGLLSFEWERMWHPYLPPIDEALRVATARDWW
jgi:sugar phosphate isomerase/epimerase